MNNIFFPFNRSYYNPCFYSKGTTYNPHNTQISKKSTNPSLIELKDNFHDTSDNDINKKNPASGINFEKEKPLLEFHGIKLFNDDLLILLLIYFLYKENINDKLLLIALFSLLF